MKIFEVRSVIFLSWIFQSLGFISWESRILIRESFRFCDFISLNFSNRDQEF